MEGWIKLHRKFLDWEWYNDPNMVTLFIYLLIKSSHKKGSWKGIIVNKGQLIFGRKKASVATGISEQSIRTCLKRLQSTSEITIKSTNQYSLITICNYDSYQDTKNKSTSKSTNNLTDDQPATNHIQEGKRSKEERIKLFEFKTKELNKEVGLNKNDIERFNLHWTQTTEKGLKLHWEKQQTFDHKKRMLTWKSKSRENYSEKKDLSKWENLANQT